MAINLLYAGLVIKILLIIVDGVLNGDVFALEGLISLLFVTWFFLALITLIGRGHNSARIAYLVIIALSLLISVYSQMHGVEPLPYTGLYILFAISSTMLHLITLLFLFQKPSSDWFKAVKANQTHSHSPQ